MSDAIKPVVWHYTNNGGASVWHTGPSSRLDADMEAAKSYPHVHKIELLYSADALSAARDAALEQAAQKCEDLGERYQDEDAHKWPEMKRDAESGCNACADAIRALKGPQK